MLEKDYLVRYLNALFEALQRIKNKVEVSSASEDEFKNAYALLGGDFNFFKEKTIDEVIDFFQRKNREHLESIYSLSRVLYYDALQQHEENVKREMLLKSKELNDFYCKHTDAYNFSDINFEAKINTELSALNN